jgi:hypothetical protein
MFVPSALVQWTGKVPILAKPLQGWKKYRNLVPRNYFELRVLQKIFQKIFQHFEITLFTQLTSYNCSTLFTLYALTSAPF